MARATLGKPRVKESKGARQARLLRALEHRVRRLEKLARPAVMYHATPVDVESLIDVRALKGEQVLMPCSTSYNFTGDFDVTAAPVDDALAQVREQLRMCEDAVTQSKQRREIAARLAGETMRGTLGSSAAAPRDPHTPRARLARLTARIAVSLRRFWRGGRS